MVSVVAPTVCEVRAILTNCPFVKSRGVAAEVAIDVADATPSEGVTNTGEVAKATVDPEPVVVAAAIAVPFPASTGEFIDVVSVMAGVDVAFATVPAKPFADTTETLETVPAPAEAYSTAVSPAFTRNTFKAFPVREAIGCRGTESAMVPVFTMGPPVSPTPVETLVTPPELSTKRRCVVGSAQTATIDPSLDDERAVRVGLLF